VPAKTDLAPHLSVDELRQRFRSCRDAKTARRWQLLWLISSGHTATAAAELVGLTDRQARRVVSLYNHQGVEAVTPRTAPGASRMLSAAQLDELKEAIQRPSPDGGVWTGTKVARWLEQATGRKDIPYSTGRKYLLRLGFSLQTGRPRHEQASAEAQDHFKKVTSPKRSKRFVVTIPKARWKRGQWTNTGSA
jgi:transposase